MKFTIERTALLKSLGHVQRVVERRTTIPILSNVLLSAEKGGLSLTATDMELSVVETLPADIGAKGQATAPAHTLYDIVRKLPEGAQIAFDYDAESARLGLSAGRSRFALSTLPVEEFPALSGDQFSHSFTLEAASLRNLIEHTSFAISVEETRYYLNGIFLHATENGSADVLRAVATDGHRLAQVEMPLPEGATGMPGVILPRKAVLELGKLMEEMSDPVEVGLSETRVRFTTADAILTSKLIDGTFPDYGRVIPTKNDKMLVVNRREFAEAVDRVSTISIEKSRAVKLGLAPGKLLLSASSEESGTASEELAVKYDAEPIEIGFNARYLLDIAQQIEGEDIELMLADASSPTLLRDLAEGSALYVLMPMRV
ncbi:MAG: DNA polymerase III subunit beta [Alphaproteobacteria bacterium]|nr:DNA polymerase III subunit beta [Alphaproteobacteria bacterium]